MSLASDWRLSQTIGLHVMAWSAQVFAPGGSPSFPSTLGGKGSKLLRTALAVVKVTGLDVIQDCLKLGRCLPDTQTTCLVLRLCIDVLF